MRPAANRATQRRGSATAASQQHAGDASRLEVRKQQAPAVGAPTDFACPRCRAGTLITGAQGWGCSRWRDGCRFVVWFLAGGKRLTQTQLRDLVTHGKTRKATFGDRTGRLVLDANREDGAVRFEADEGAVPM